MGMYNKPVGKKVNAKSIPGYLLFYVNNHVGIELKNWGVSCLNV